MLELIVSGKNGAEIVETLRKILDPERRGPLPENVQVREVNRTALFKD